MSEEGLGCEQGRGWGVSWEGLGCEWGRAGGVSGRRGSLDGVCCCCYGTCVGVGVWEMSLIATSAGAYPINVAVFVRTLWIHSCVHC